jgi:hypothetical protein
MVVTGVGLTYIKIKNRDPGTVIAFLVLMQENKLTRYKYCSSSSSFGVQDHSTSTPRSQRMQNSGVDLHVW